MYDLLIKNLRTDICILDSGSGLQRLHSTGSVYWRPLPSLLLEETRLGRPGKQWAAASHERFRMTQSMVRRFRMTGTTLRMHTPVRSSPRL